MVKVNILKGMKEITAFVGYSETTVLKHKREYLGMPISKVSGEWIGNPVTLNLFYQDLAAGQADRWLELPRVTIPKKVDARE